MIQMERCIRSVLQKWSNGPRNHWDKRKLGRSSDKLRIERSVSQLPPKEMGG